MENRVYPTLPQGIGTNLAAIERLMEFDPGYLADEKCPYPPEVKAYLRRLVGPLRTGQDDTVTAVFREGAPPEEEADNLMAEIQNAINAMRRLQQEMEGGGIEVQDKLNFLKSYGALIERFLSLKEKSQGLKQLYEFQRLVIETMEQVLDKDQRYEFKEKLKQIGIVTA